MVIQHQELLPVTAQGYPITVGAGGAGGETAPGVQVVD